MSGMGSAGSLASLRRVRVWLGHALLVAFVLKALIPAGFMPDFSGHDGQSFKIVICTANGSKLVDAGDDSSGGSVTKHAGEPCALSALAALAAPDVATSVAYSGLLNSARQEIAPAAVLPPVRAGPAHSPRAPPSLV
ncbi:MAG: hypothetical protein B7Y80_10255 [Hyphomicrobium sp. 32-62-53]|nr:MAG: hypothetical protein B7Z29_12130 [Hyphomicrobium sp. 12-62-95]OYX99667.1 MAG: hypothetical protein B7Y80_10255 [Hyphomicrobium sp. 32-62-53]